MSPPGIPFTKIHGAGNDFLIVSREDVRGDAGELAVQMCDRHTGVGADGVVLLGPGAQGADAGFRIYNADGSEAGLSGNGLRCAAAWVVNQKSKVGSRKLKPNERVSFETKVGLRELFFLERRGPEWVFRAEVGRPAFAAKDVPFRPPRAADLREPIVNFPLPAGDTVVHATILSMGNPQCNVMVEDWSTVNWMALGAELERHPYFPERANIGFVRPIGADRIEVRFWERGAGHTLASGTGSCAGLVAAHLAGRCGRRARVELERAAMEVNWRDDGMVELTGPAEIVADGEFHCAGDREAT